MRNGGGLSSIVAAAAVLAMASPLAAQKIPAGSWGGSIAAEGMSVVVTFDVTVNGDSVGITLRAEFGEFSMQEVKVLEDRITFSFVPGPVVRCNLPKKEDGSYSGTCADDSGESATMTMIPPKPGLAVPEPSRTSVRAPVQELLPSRASVAVRARRSVSGPRRASP